LRAFHESRRQRVSAEPSRKIAFSLTASGHQGQSAAEDEGAKRLSAAK